MDLKTPDLWLSQWTDNQTYSTTRRMLTHYDPMVSVMIVCVWPLLLAHLPSGSQEILLPDTPAAAGSSLINMLDNEFELVPRSNIRRKYWSEEAGLRWVGIVGRAIWVRRKRNTPTTARVSRSYIRTYGRRKGQDVVYTNKQYLARALIAARCLRPPGIHVTGWMAGSLAYSRCSRVPLQVHRKHPKEYFCPKFIEGRLKRVLD